MYFSCPFAGFYGDLGRATRNGYTSSRKVSCDRIRALAVALTVGVTDAVAESVGVGVGVGVGELVGVGVGVGDGDADGEGEGDGDADGGDDRGDGDGRDEPMGTVGPVAATNGMMGVVTGGSEGPRRVEWAGFTVIPAPTGAVGAENGAVPAAMGGSGASGWNTSAPNKTPPANTARTATPAVRRAGGFGR